MDQLLVTLTAALELKQSLSYLDLGEIISSAGLVVVTGFNLFSSSESVIPKSENKKEKAVLHSQKAVEVTWENRLFKGLSQTRADIWGKIGKLLGSAELSQDVIDQLEETLFSSDLSPRIVEELIDHIKSIHRPEVEGTNDYLKEIKTFLKSKMSDAQAKVNTDLYKYDEKKSQGLKVIMIVGVNGAGKTTMLRILAGIDPPDTGARELGHGAVVGYYAQEHETLNPTSTVWETMAAAGSHLNDTQQRTILGSFLFQGDSVHKPTGVLSGGEKTRLALACLVVSGSNVLLLDEPTNNLDPASRAEVLNALSLYEGAVVLVTHDPGAVRALNPERVLILPDGDEDLWSESYIELIELA